ncbi:MAG: putative glycoside hydrolase [Gudongella sp.]|nr:putative glycoside hydrolase [Gudongella sp.]
MKKNIFLLLSLIILSLVLSGCTSNEQTPNESVKENESIEVEKEEETPKEPELSEEDKQKVLQAEREDLEKIRKDEMGEFYVPLPPLGEDKELQTVKAKALYITGNVAGFKFQEENIDYYADYINAINGQSGKSADLSRLDEINKLEKVLGIAKASEINALVIDIKDDHGYVTWTSELEIVKQVGSNVDVWFDDYKPLMDYLEQNQIYTIARIVAFKDPLFAKSKPEHAIQLKVGGVYLDNNGEAWVNPFNEYVWNYVIAVSREAALRGFDEIQYDYVRFPDRAAYYNPITEFPGRNDRDKDEGIEDFLALASKELEPYNVHIAADVFGIITHSWDDIPDDIGQTWRKVANQVEYICPMIYPSHYGTGVYGYDVPDKHPYEISRLAVMEAIERNAAQKDPAIIRPWFQGFSAPWVKGHIKYDAKAISDQMVAAQELGVEEYVIWNASNNYDPMSFFYQDRIDKTILSNDNVDIMERTPELALDRFLKAQRSIKYSQLYLLTPIENREEDYDKFVEDMKKINPILKSFTVSSINKNEGKGYLAIVDVSYTSDLGTFNSEIAEYEIIDENGIFKVRAPEIKWEKEISE